MALSIRKLDALYDEASIPTLAEAVRALAGFDTDGATVRNDVGFNKLDTGFGRSMATIPMDRWSYRQANAVYQMLRKYRRQLEQHWSIDYDSLVQPDPERWGVATQVARVVDIQPTDEGGSIFVLTFGRDPALLAVLKEIPGLRWDKEGSSAHMSRWTCKAAADAAEVIADIVPTRDFLITAAASARITQLTHGFKEALSASSAGSSDPIASITLGDIVPYGYQWAGPRYILDHADSRGFIADERGVGKTLQALIAMEAAEAYPHLIVTPNNVKFKWVREIQRALPNRKVLLVSGRDLGARQKADIYVTNWESLSDGFDPKVFGKRVVLLKPSIDRISARGLKGITFDESHKAKNPSAQRTVAALNLADSLRRHATLKGFKPLIMALTGTPVQNKPDELWPQIEILGRGDDFGGYFGFMKKFGRYKASMRNRPPEEMPELQQLNTMLRGLCMVRRLKKDVLSEMPALTRSMLPLEIDNPDEYARAQQNAARWFGERAARDAEFLLSIADLSEEEQGQAKRERAMDAEVRAARGRAFVVIQALKNVAVKGKMGGVREWCEEFLDESAKGLVVFADHRPIQDELTDMMANEDPALILGGMNGSVRDAENMRFQARETRVCIGSMKAAAEGIDLTAASDLLCVELGWNPGHHTQVEGRIDRVGQTEPCTAYYPIAMGTIEEDIFELIWRSKAHIVGNVTDGVDHETFEGRSTDAISGDDEPGILKTLARRLAGLAGRKRWISQKEAAAIAAAEKLSQAGQAADLADMDAVDLAGELSDDAIDGDFRTVEPEPAHSNGSATPALPAPVFTDFTEGEADFPDEADDDLANSATPDITPPQEDLDDEDEYITIGIAL